MSFVARGEKMLPGIYSTAVQVEMNYHEPASENIEEYAQKHGVVVIFPTLGDRIKMKIGQTLISLGHKMRASSMENACSLSHKMA